MLQMIQKYEQILRDKRNDIKESWSLIFLEIFTISFCILDKGVDSQQSTRTGNIRKSFPVGSVEQSNDTNESLIRSLQVEYEFNLQVPRSPPF